MRKRYFIINSQLPKVSKNNSEEQCINKKTIKNFKNSIAYEKYVKPLKNQTKLNKKQKLLKWLKEHTFDILQAIGTIVAIIISIFALMK